LGEQKSFQVESKVLTELGVVAHTCDPSTQKAERQEGHEFEASLSYIVRCCLKKQIKKQSQEPEKGNSPGQLVKGQNPRYSGGPKGGAQYSRGKIPSPLCAGPGQGLPHPATINWDCPWFCERGKTKSFILHLYF
jgi:hypothetical protein